MSIIKKLTKKIRIIAARIKLAMCICIYKFCTKIERKNSFLLHKKQIEIKVKTIKLNDLIEHYETPALNVKTNECPNYIKRVEK